MMMSSTNTLCHEGMYTAPKYTLCKRLYCSCIPHITISIQINLKHTEINVSFLHVIQKLNPANLKFKLSHTDESYLHYNQCCDTILQGPLLLHFQSCLLKCEVLSQGLFTLGIRFLRPLQYMIPMVAATIHIPPIAAIIPIRTTRQKSSLQYQLQIIAQN